MKTLISLTLLCLILQFGHFSYSRRLIRVRKFQTQLYEKRGIRKFYRWRQESEGGVVLLIRSDQAARRDTRVTRRLRSDAGAERRVERGQFRASEGIVPG